MLTTCSTRDDKDVDLVVKLNGAMDFGVRAAAFEMVGSLIAGRLGIGRPEPFLVWLSPEFLSAIASREPSASARLQNSIGWNFGSKMMKDASIWAVDATVPSRMLSDALKIFAFDGLIQNVDRRHDNPNLFTLGDQLIVIDHELAFSFLTAILPSSSPWTIGSGDYMERHALRSGLKRNILDWSPCKENLLSLTEEFFASINEFLPEQWQASNDLAAIIKHVKQIMANIDLFISELQRRVA